MGSNEVRAKLKSHISKLADKRADVKEASHYWESFWLLPTSMDDIVSVFTPCDIRYIRDNNTDGFTKLILSITNRLIYLSNCKNEKNNTHLTDQLLNCVRILTIFLPFIYEKKHLSYIEDEIFWNRIYYPLDYGSTNNDEMDPTILSGINGLNIHNSNGNVTEMNLIDLNDDTTHNNNDKSENKNKNKDKNHFMLEEGKPIGAELIIACLDMLFTLGLTVEDDGKHEYKSKDLINNYQLSVWEPGLEKTGLYQEPNLMLDSNRLEIIRFLLVLFSKNMYTPVSDVVNTGSKFLTVFVTSTDGRKFYILCLSLWNLIIRSIQSNDDSNGKNKNGLDITVDEHKHLRILTVTNSLQLFTLMVVYPLPKRDLAFLFRSNIIHDSNGPPRNRTRMFLGKILDSKDLQLIIKSLTSPLFKPMIDTDSGAFSYLMKSSKFIEDKEIHTWGTEIMMILLEFFQCNGKFRAHFAALVGSDFFVLLIYYILKFRNDKKHRSFVKLNVYFLLILSGDLRLSSKLLTPFDLQLYESLPQILRTSTIPTSYRDFLMIHICQIIVLENPFIYVSPLVQVLYNLIPLHAYIRAINKTENREVLGNRRLSVKDLSKCPPTQISYAASSCLFQTVVKLGRYSFIVKDPKPHLDYLSLILMACCHAITRDPYDSVVLLYLFSKNNDFFAKLNEVIKRISYEASIGLIEEEKKEYNLKIQNQMQAQSYQQQQEKHQHQQQVSSTDPWQTPNYIESRESVDMPSLSRQSTQNTLESIPSIRNMPPLSKQNSQISISNASPRLSNAFSDDGIDPMSITGYNNNNNNNTNNDTNDNNDANHDDNSNGENDNDINGNDGTSRDNDTDISQQDSALVLPFKDEIFHAEFPLGMTEKSRSKRLYYESFERKWSGENSLKLLNDCVNVVNGLMYTQKKSEYESQATNASDVIQKLIKMDLEIIIDNIAKADMYNPKRFEYHPLKFKWDIDVLGWYISLIWGDIFINYNIYSSKGILAELSSGLSAIKKVSTAWGIGSWKFGSTSDSLFSSKTNPSPLASSIFAEDYDSKAADLSVYYDNILKTSVWFGTHIELFRVNPVMLKEHFALQHGKSDLSSHSTNLNGNFSPVFTEVFWKRNSISSPILNMRNGSGVFTEGFWKRQGGRPGSLDRRDSDGSLKLQLSRNPTNNISTINANKQN